MKRWLGGSKNASTQSLTALDEPQALKDAMAGAIHILNDDVETADALLSKGSSPFHKLGRGVVSFLRATLGFEPEVMKQAAEILAQSEEAAYEHQRHAQRDAYQSPIYPAGSEYALCMAESQLMSAVVAVLSENLTESLKGFYKLRKAYVTLQTISDAEKKFVASRKSAVRTSQTGSKQSLASTRPGSNRSTDSFASTRVANKEFGGTRKSDKDLEDDDLDFVDADESLQASTPAHYQGHIDSADVSSKLGDLKVASESTHDTESIHDPLQDDEPDIEELTRHPVDLFIHSGTSLCFGILNLLLSLIPPAFSKLLYVVGFKGDREEGLAMLWRAIKHSDINGINGAIAGLVTLGYYNGMVGFCDIVSKDAYPKEKLRALLKKMRNSYPQSTLWMLEEARMLAGDRRLEDAIVMGDPVANPSKLKQVLALQYFELSLNQMYLHQYQACADAFLKCVTLNNWSHGLYYYIAGVCHVELYREYRSSDPKAAQKHAHTATELLRGVPSRAGKKRLLSKPLPFDAFVSRKVAKWEARAIEWKVDLIDAVGVAPVEEMIYFWNGYKRMRPEHLEESLARLAAHEDPTHNPQWAKEGIDERAILSFLRAVTVSRLGRTAESKRILQTEIQTHDWSEFKKENWTLPVSYYEYCVNLYVECGGERGSVAQLTECSTYLERTARWESYDLDARIGLKITTARDTLRKCGVVAT